MSITAGLNAAAETLFRATVKSALKNQSAEPAQTLPVGLLGDQYILPPLLGEMGGEIRHHLAKVEPWLRNGWKVMSRYPAFYPEGAAIYDAGFFREVDDIRKKYNVIGAYGSLYIPPRQKETYQLQIQIEQKHLEITCSDLVPVFYKSLAETELRNVFLKWFYSPNRHITDYDHYVLSFSGSARGNSTYHDGYALLPTYLPPTFQNPPEAAPPHVGVQIRHMDKTPERNSEPQWMLKTAQAIADHLGVELLVYGHPGGCSIPAEGYKTTWDKDRPENQMARELGYLKSCRVMLAPDSGWTDLMLWLGVPTFLEKLLNTGELTPYRNGIRKFRPRLRIFDRSHPAGEQTDALLNDPPWDLPGDRWYQTEDPREFPTNP